MRKLRMLAGALVLALILNVSGVRTRAWMGVMYKDALLLARADGEMPEDETEVVFVWPLWEWLMRVLGFQ